MEMRVTYKCPICGEEHEADQICPVINKKITKYEKKRRDVYVWGNIFLECYKREKKFFSILRQIMYLVDFYSSFSSRLSEYKTGEVLDIRNHLSMDLVLEYFANEIGVSVTSFMKKPEKNLEEFAEILNKSDYAFYDVEGVFSDNEETVFSVNVTDALFPERPNPGLSTPLELIKIVNNDGKVHYQLWCTYPSLSMRLFNCRYHTQLLGLSGEGVLLAEDTDGPIKDFFENAYPKEAFAKYVPFSDEKMKEWIVLLLNATNRDTINWHYYEIGDDPNRVRIKSEGYYGNTEIKIDIDYSKTKQDKYRRKDATLLYVLPEMGHPIRYGRDEDVDPMEYGGIFTPDVSTDILYLANAINKSVERLKHKTEELKVEKELTFSDTLVVGHSMLCEYRGHSITPCIGIVPILTKDNIVSSFRVYLGHCHSCRSYIMFREDYERMIRSGKPLCVVNNVEQPLLLGGDNRFRYRSQSILNAMGYNVQAKNDLTREERLAIIQKAISQKLIDVHETIEFLRWLIRTRMTQKKYQKAVEKWTEDMEYIKENYPYNEHTNVKSITVRNRIKKEDR